MLRTRTGVLIVLIITALTLLVIGCSTSNKGGSKAPAPAPETKQAAAPEQKIPATPLPPTPKALEKASFGVSSKSISILPIVVAQQNGFFKQEGLDMEIVVMKSDLATAGLTEGSLDYTQGLGIIAKAAAQGLPVKVATYINDKPGFWLVGKKINDVKELKGKGIGVSRVGSMTHEAGILMIEHLGLNASKDVNWLSLGDVANTMAALEGGSIAAGVMILPDNIRALKMGYKQLAFVGDVMSLPQNGLCVSDKKIAENPEQIKRVMRALLKATAYIYEPKNKSEVIAFMVKEYKLDQKLAEEVYEVIIKDEAYSRDGTVDEKAMRWELEFAVGQGALTKEQSQIPFDKFINFKLLQEVQKELGLKK